MKERKSKSYRLEALPADYRKAFKDADIRGVYNTEIDEVLAYRVAMAFVQHFALPEVLVARDMRLSSPAVSEAFIQGVLDAGADVIDLGLAETPALYYASGTYNAAGVVVTASHNPKEYNGLKLVTAGAKPVTGKTGLTAIRKIVEAGTPPMAATRGTKKKKNILREYVRYVQNVVPVPAMRPARVVIDAGNGMASLALSALATKIPLQMEPLFCELDGTFPNRESNPTLAKNQKAIVAKLKEGGYDFGVAFDGDADRLAFFDETGRYINSAHIGALLATAMLEEHPASTFIYTVFTSRRYLEAITTGGGKARKARVGHAFIKEQMRKTDAIFSCEHSAHFYFRDNFYADSGVLVLLHLLKAFGKARNAGMTFSQLMQPYRNYFQTEEVLVSVADKYKVLRALETKYTDVAGYSVVNFDGLTVLCDEYWFVVKKSVTEDALKFVVESPTKSLALKKQKEVLALLQSL